MGWDLCDLAQWLWNEIAHSGEFWSAIAGAIVGGAIAFGIQIISLREAAKQRESDALDKRRGLGYSLLFKLIRIYSNLWGFHSHLEEAFYKANKQQSKAAPWQFVTPILNGPDFVHFSSDEMAMVLSFKSDDVFNLIASLDEIHNSTVEVFNAYRHMRVALLSDLPADVGEGMVFSTVLTETHYKMMVPKMAELDDLLMGLRERCKKDSEESWEALSKVHALFVEHLGFTHKIQKKSLNL